MFEARRRKQVVDWTLAMAEQHVRDRFYRTDAVKALLDTVRGEVARAETTAAVGAQRLLDAFYAALSESDTGEA